MGFVVQLRRQEEELRREEETLIESKRQAAKAVAKFQSVSKRINARDPLRTLSSHDESSAASGADTDDWVTATVDSNALAAG